MSKFLEDPHNTRIDYLGPEISKTPLPAFFYFALSGSDSLELHPYNQPVLMMQDPAIRIFSFTLPGHEENLNKFHAMQYWAERMLEGHYLLEEFFEKVSHAIHWLIEEKIVDSQKMAAGGLSRGAFIATHIAAKLPYIRTLLGFAPLTDLMQLKEFSEHPELQRRCEELNLTHLTDTLTHVAHFRYYIGNRDRRVGTDACFHFIRALADKSHEKHARHQKIELMITHSIGHKGHGTAPHLFEEGTLWAKSCLLGSSS